jgi:hypothetical protein
VPLFTHTTYCRKMPMFTGGFGSPIGKLSRRLPSIKEGCIITKQFLLPATSISPERHSDNNKFILKLTSCRVRLKCDGTRAETRFRLSAKRTNPFKSAGASVQSTAGSRDVLISGSNAGYTMFRGSVKSTGYPVHSPVSPSLPLPCVTVCRVPNSNYVTVVRDRNCLKILYFCVFFVL